MQQIAHELRRMHWLWQVQDEQGQGDSEDAVDECVKSPRSQSWSPISSVGRQLPYKHAGYDV